MDVLLVQRPADALNNPTLHLALDVTGVDRPSGVLGGRVAKNCDLAGLRVNLDIADVGRKRRPRTSGGERDRRRQWAAGAVGRTCQLREGHRRLGALYMLGLAIDPLDVLEFTAPHLGRACPQIADDLSASFDHCHSDANVTRLPPVTSL